MNRRDFLQRTLVGTSLFLPISSLFSGRNAMGASEPSQAPSLSAGDVALSTTALNAGYLESEFFLRALTGNGLSSEDTSGLGAGGPVLVSKEGPLKFRNPSIKAIAEQITRDELAHVHDIRNSFASFGLTPPARPTIDLKNTFLMIAEGAGINRNFDPLASETDFLLFAFFLEQITNSAFVGAIPLLQNNAIKSLATSLLGTEASHNGSVRLGLAQEKLFDDANKIAAFTQTLVNSAQTIIRPLFDGQLLLSPVGDDGLVAPLDGRQFLNCVLLGINANAGGFYPNGLNFA